MIPRREALSALLLLALLAVALHVVPERLGPGPLALVTALAALHGTLLSPLVGRGPVPWGFLPPLLALPAIAASAYGHEGSLLWALLLVSLAAASGSSARALGPWGGLYGATVVLLFALPYALSYVVQEFGTSARADAWLSPSPWAAAWRVADGGPPPAAAILALLAWPVFAIARLARRGPA